MKKSSKPGIVLSLLIFVLAALTILAYVGIKKKCEVLSKEKTLAEEKLNSKKNRKVNLLAQYQMLTSEDRITGIALNELGMKKRLLPAQEIKVDKKKIERINKLIKEKYE